MQLGAGVVWGSSGEALAAAVHAMLLPHLSVSDPSLDSHQIYAN